MMRRLAWCVGLCESVISKPRLFVFLQKFIDVSLPANRDQGPGRDLVFNLS